MTKWYMDEFLHVCGNIIFYIDHPTFEASNPFLWRKNNRSFK